MNFRSIVKTLIPESLFRRIEPTGHFFEAVLAQLINGYPARNLKIIGVTGTDGKTTTCSLIAQMLRESGIKVAMMTTVSIDYGDGAGEHYNSTRMTTTGAMELTRRLKKVKQAGADWLVLETTSMALAQHRTWGVPYSIAVLTNLTQDHLDYHKTPERYKASKLSLFKMTDRNRKGLRVGIINADDQSAADFSRNIANPLRYGIKAGELRASDIKLTTASSRYTVQVDDDEYRIECHLPGKFNVYNSLAAVGVGRVIGLTEKQIEKGIASLQSVEGRMARVDTGSTFNVIIDYAHTEGALQNVLTAVKETTTGKVILIFGATGDRDKLKRPDMGRVAAEYADRIYLTDDETYTEDPKAIIDEVYQGIVSAGGAEKTTIVDERRQAIRTAISEAKPGDTILLTGIGHQQHRNMGGQKVAWDERQVVLDELKK